MNIVQKLLFKARTGYTDVNLGKTEEYVLRFKNIYISVLIGENDTSVGYFNDPPSHFPVRDIIEVK